ncbi:sigma-54-dependent Fis family transcriptional regulator [Candidatus Nitronereus thalassa]|uniref:Sigma 54-interacting transcriptional regulator n=1 Tax=Candidatus Nitronereus thalassa TaxID=3020898 RepID=A0ABU3K9W6_9BACT|nr:sigma 54-interacting transcriptional regulator [Candidatus Nitronereus thalassa]MDT7043211.1 sigma 54-interacting transcriptional regulator [Candidatus Nitronereus thalassa]
MNRIETNYRALLKVAIELNSQRNTKSLWQAITAQIHQVMPWARASVTLYDAEADGFRFYVVATNLPKVVVKQNSVIPRMGSGMGWVYEHKTFHVRPDLKHEQVFLEDAWYVKEGLGRMINFPLLVKEKCLGILNIGSVDAGHPSSEDLEFLSQVAMQIAYAIDHVQAYEEISRLHQQLARENTYLVQELKQTKMFGPMVGKSRLFQEALALAREVAPTSATVLITGETGTGKELLAQAIHDESPRKDKPLVRINCAALPIGLVESELFGHERGAFTGAEAKREGRFELANGGTLFLDEIGEMPLETQAKLLRVIQDGLVDRVGGKHSIPVDVRLIAATNADLSTAIVQGRFRADLFYRIHVFPITIPPLRSRPEDIPELAQHFLEHYRIKFKRPCETIEQDSLRRLIRYSWPGNIRELENVIERAVILSHDSVLRIEDRLLTPSNTTPVPKAPADLLDVERQHILQTLAATNWQIEGGDGAAKQLGLAPSTLRSRIKKLQLQRPGHHTLES